MSWWNNLRLGMKMQDLKRDYEKHKDEDGLFDTVVMNWKEGALCPSCKGKDVLMLDDLRIGCHECGEVGLLATWDEETICIVVRFKKEPSNAL